MIEAGESKEVKHKYKLLTGYFPNLFEYINPKDVLFYRIERNGGMPMHMIPNNVEPWKYLLSYKYILVIYEEFDSLPVNLQMMQLAHQMLRIPPTYREANGIRAPDVVMYKEETEIHDRLRDGFDFPQS